MGRAKIIPTDPDKIFLPYQQAWVDDRTELNINYSCETGEPPQNSYQLFQRISSNTIFSPLNRRLSFKCGV
jgi:hypothetical protein